MKRFDVEVEILDSLSGIDVGSLSQPADEFGERVSELRLAWVAAAEWTTINLLRPDRRRTSQAALSRAAVVAGVAAGLGSGWSIARSDSWSVAAASPARTRPAPVRTAVDALEFSAPPSRPSEASPAATSGTLLAREEPTPLAAPDPPPIRQEPAVARFEPPPIDEIRERVLAPAPTPIHPEPPPIRHEPPGAVRSVAREVMPRRVQLSAPQQPPKPQLRPAQRSAPVRRGPQQHSVFRGSTTRHHRRPCRRSRRCGS